MPPDVDGMRPFGILGVVGARAPVAPDPGTRTGGTKLTIGHIDEDSLSEELDPRIPVDARPAEHGGHDIATQGLDSPVPGLDHHHPESADRGDAEFDGATRSW